MKLNIRGKDMKITEAMKNYADEKFTKLEKYLKDGEDIKAKLLFKIDGINQKLEVTIPLKNITLRVEEKGKDFYSCIDTALDKLERSIIKNKKRLESKKMKAKYGFEFEKLDLLTKNIEEDNTNKIVKKKSVELKPMDFDEAILQMELLGHDFYVFKDEKTNKTCVLYKRKEQGYGIIEEE